MKKTGLRAHTLLEIQGGVCHQKAYKRLQVQA